MYEYIMFSVISGDRQQYIDNCSTSSAVHYVESVWIVFQNCPQPLQAVYLYIFTINNKSGHLHKIHTLA